MSTPSPKRAAWYRRSWTAISERTHHAWRSVTAWVVLKWALLRFWWARLEAQRMAEHRLTEQLTASGPASEQRVAAGLAKKMARLAPRGTILPADGLYPTEAPALAGESTLSEGRIESVQREENEPVQESIGGVAPIPVWLQPSSKELKSPVSLRRLDRREKGDKLQVTAEEAVLASTLTDAAVLAPRPRRAEVQKIDLSVTGSWERNPYTIDEVASATRLPIVHNQIREILQHLITSRPYISGPKELVEPIRRWMEVEVEAQTGHRNGIDRFVLDLATQLLYNGSGIIVKQRSLSATVRPIADPLRDRMIAPVWGYIVPDMATVEVFIDSAMRPRKWRQRPDLFPSGQAKEYTGSDVFLARLPTQNSSLYFWTPPYVAPALMAVSVLRSLHEMIDAHTRSIVDLRYYVTVGDKDYLDGRVTQQMVNDTVNTINLAARGTTPVLPWHNKLNPIQLDEYVKQLVAAAEFWEREIRRGVGGSMLQDGIGDSATRNTSDALVEKEMRAAQTLVPEIQRAFRWLVLDKLYEIEGFDWTQIQSHEDLPALRFEEIDMSQQIRRETHYVSLWNSDGLTHAEFRRAIGKDIDPEREELYFSDIQAEKAIEQSETELDVSLRMEKEKAKIRSQVAPRGTPRPKRRQA